MGNKEDLLKLLDDIEIINKIKSIITDETITTSSININYYEERIKELEEINKKLLQENKNIEDDFNKNKIRYETELSKNKIRVEELENSFKELEKVYSIYKSLNKENINALSGIFKGENISGFIFCGVQHDNIEMLWDYIKFKIIEDDLSDVDKLISLFDYFFNAYNRTYDKPLYKKMNTKISSKFEDDLHIRIKSSNVSGEITEVLLDGYVNCNTNKIVKKSVVKI